MLDGFCTQIGRLWGPKKPGLRKGQFKRGWNTIVGTLEVAVLTITLDVLADSDRVGSDAEAEKVVMKAARDGG
jgi:hypothetical protein